MTWNNITIIDHRVNTIEGLLKTPKDRGVEIDIRDYDGGLVLTHEPFTKGDSLEEYLKNYHHKFIIFNTKVDGITSHILELVKKYNIKDYFFLDLANPTLIWQANKGVRDIAARFSEYEPVEACLALKGKVEWVWVDCFNSIPLNQENYSVLSKHFKLCLVSPEMQGHPLDWIEKFKQDFKQMPIQAVCTDRPDLWL